MVGKFRFVKSESFKHINVIFTSSNLEMKKRLNIAPKANQSFSITLINLQLSQAKAVPLVLHNCLLTHPIQRQFKEDYTTVGG